MFTTFRRSRGWGKMRRNRGAMLALWIIAAYLLLAGWIVAMEAADAVGRWTGAFDLRRNAYLSAMLPERTLERVGPRWVAGFGAEQKPGRREDQADYVFTLVEPAVNDAAAEQDAAARRAVLDRVMLGERRIVDKPFEEIQQLVADAKASFTKLDQQKQAKTALLKIEQGLSAAQEGEHGIAAAGSDAEKLKQAQDAAGVSVEEVMFSLEDYTKVAGQGDVLKPSAEELSELQASADDLRDGKGEFPTARLAAIRTRLAQQKQAIEESPGYLEDLKSVEAAVDRLMPLAPDAHVGLHKARLLLGTDDQGRSILVRGLYSAKIAIQVGIIVAVISVLIGGVLGAAAAYFGGWVDHLVTWLYSTLSSLPQLVLLAVLSFMFLGGPLEKTLVPIYVALGLTFWIGPCRVIRGEVLKIKELEFAQAATVIGFSRPYILLKHVLPNTMHLMFINFSLLFIGAIKSEVILTFLGLGVKEGSSWGLMISQSKNEVITGFYWQIGVATVLMLVLVLAFNIVSDALQDAFDPRHVG